MLEIIREELNKLTAANMDRLTNPLVVSKSQELDIDVVKKQREIYEAYKKGNNIIQC